MKNNYTDEFLQDKKIATAVFNRYFRTFKNQKDDLIQMALVRLWQIRQDPLKHWSITYASKTAHNFMADYLKRECKFLNPNYNISVFNEIVDGLLMQDTLKDSCDYEPENILAYDLLVKDVNTVLDTFNDKGKEIIRMYLNHRSLFEIAKCFDMSKKGVHKYIIKFRDAVSRKIDCREVA